MGQGTPSERENWGRNAAEKKGEMGEKIGPSFLLLFSEAVWEKGVSQP